VASGEQSEKDAQEKREWRMSGSRRKRSASSDVERLRLRQKITHDYLHGGYTSQHELAVRYGVSDATVCQILKQIKTILREEFEEQFQEETAKRLAQLELMIGKANSSFEISKQEQVEITIRTEKCRCGKCSGTGERDGETCPGCEGRGYNLQEVETKKVSGQAGDPRFLAIVLKGIQEIARIRQLYPERQTTRRTTKIGRQYNVGAIAVENRLEGASQEMLLEARRLMLRIEQSKNRDDIADVEFGKSDESKE